MPKLIREGRFGPSKCWKTGSIVGTYPKPMMVYSLDSGGLDIIPQKGTILPSNYYPIDISAEDIKYIKPREFEEWKKKPITEQPKVLAIDFAQADPRELNLLWSFPKDSNSLPDFINICNSILRGPCPWKTVVLDNFSRLSDIILGFMVGANPGMMNDARQWASATGQKIAAINAELTKLPCHYVCLMHEDTDKNELTGEIRTEPLIYSKVRGLIGGSLSSFFHQKKVNGKPMIDTTDMAYVKGIGQRWPVNLPPECAPTFQAIYGESVKNGEVTLL